MNKKQNNTSRTVQIFLDTVAQKLSIKGRSINSDPEIIFHPLISLIKGLSDHHNSFTCDINLEYFNSSSAKCILQLLGTKHHLTDKNFFSTINWYYEEDDDDSKDFGIDLKEILKVPINLVSVT
jgi:hypothetical protein